MDNSRRLIHFYDNPDSSDVLERDRRDFVNAMEKDFPFNANFMENFEFSSDSDSEAETKIDIAEEKEEPS